MWRTLSRVGIVVGIVAGLAGIWSVVAPRAPSAPEYQTAGAPTNERPYYGNASDAVDAPFEADYSSCMTYYAASGLCVMRDGGRWIWNEESGLFEPE